MTAEHRTATAPPVARRERWTLAVITAAFAAVVAVWGVLTPLYDAPDEPLHVNSIIRLAEGGGWPAPGEAEVQKMVLGARGQVLVPAPERATFSELREAKPGYRGVDQMTQHPPLYYAFGAVMLSAIDFMDIRADLVLLYLRWVGVLFALPLPFLVWDSIRRLTRSPRAAIVGATALLCVPQLAHIMGSVSNDGLAVLTSSLTTWLAIRVMTGSTRWRTIVALGLALALALLTKGTTLPLVPFVALVLLVWPREMSIGRRLLRAGVTMALGFIGGLWWARNLLVYRQLQPDGLNHPSAPWAEGTDPNVLGFVDAAWNSVTSSFWGKFGWLAYPLPQMLTDILTVICLAVVLVFAFRRGPARTQALVLATLPLMLFAALMVTTWSGYLRTQLMAGLQGRYFFPAILALIALSAIAWRNFLSPRDRRPAGVLLVLAFGAVTAFGVYIDCRSVYASFGDMLARVPLQGPLVWITLVGGAIALIAAMIAAIRFIRGPRQRSVRAEGPHAPDQPPVDTGESSNRARHADTDASSRAALQ